MLIYFDHQTHQARNRKFDDGLHNRNWHCQFRFRNNDHHWINQKEKKFAKKKSQYLSCISSIVSSLGTSILKTCFVNRLHISSFIVFFDRFPIIYFSSSRHHGVSIPVCDEIFDQWYYVFAEFFFEFELCSIHCPPVVQKNLQNHGEFKKHWLLNQNCAWHGLPRFWKNLVYGVLFKKFTKNTCIKSWLWIFWWYV